MPRIRTIKPEFFLDDELAELPSLTRLFFVGLWTQADRAGRLKDKPVRLKTAILPYDDADADTLLAQLEAGGFIRRYEVEGERCVEIRNFTKHQRFTNESASTLPPVGEDYESRRTVLAQGKEGKGKEEERKESSPPPFYDDGEFHEFWSAYPRKVGKPAARLSWGKATAKASAEVILAALATYPFNGDIQFIPHPATWLNQERWTDDTSRTAETFGGKDYGVDPC